MLEVRAFSLDTYRCRFMSITFAGYRLVTNGSILEQTCLCGELKISFPVIYVYI